MPLGVLRQTCEGRRRADGEARFLPDSPLTPPSEKIAQRGVGRGRVANLCLLAPCPCLPSDTSRLLWVGAAFCSAGCRETRPAGRGDESERGQRGTRLGDPEGLSKSRPQGERQGCPKKSPFFMEISGLADGILKVPFRMEVFVLKAQRKGHAFTKPRAQA